MDEYRELVSTAGTMPPSNNETIVKLTQEKEQLTKEVAELNQFIKTLKAQLELAESKVLNDILCECSEIRQYLFVLLLLLFVRVLLLIPEFSTLPTILWIMFAEKQWNKFQNLRKRTRVYGKEFV